MYANLEPETSTLQWLFQLDDFKSLHEKWLFHQTSIKKWLFGVPGIYHRPMDPMEIVWNLLQLQKTHGFLLPKSTSRTNELPNFRTTSAEIRETLGLVLLDQVGEVASSSTPGYVFVFFFPKSYVCILVTFLLMVIGSYLLVVLMVNSWSGLVVGDFESVRLNMKFP